MKDWKMSAIVLTLLLGCAGRGLASDADSIKVKMTNADRQEVGEVTLTQTPQGVLIRIDLPQKTARIPAGTHAFHVHQVGKCEPPFTSAGAHFNPEGKKHGFLDSSGGHAGDLPNIHVPEKGALTVEFIAPQLSLKQGKNNLFDSDGSALVIHARQDDYKTDPAGEAGDRIACGVIERSSK
jgi:superoxide dismutase, Cu-Zn family